MWIFGYGSLIWKPNFPYQTEVAGFIQGFVRRFYQHSTDHRGVPEKPGRVVTLVPSDDPDSRVWGVAYKLNDEDISSVMKQLDFREKNGYKKTSIIFYPKDKTNEPINLETYVATEENESYAGAASIEDIAAQVIQSKGPSGTNKEYVYKLAESMRKIAPEENDEHLFQLEAAVRKLDNENSIVSENDRGDANKN